MHCENQDYLWAYLAQELSGEERAAFERHLAECEICRAEFAEEERLLRTLRDLPEPELPEGFHAELMEKLRRADAQRAAAAPKEKKQIRWRGMSLIAATVLLVAALGGVNGILDARQPGADMALQAKATEDAAAEISEAVPKEESTAEIASAAEGRGKQASAPLQPSTDVGQPQEQDISENAEAASPLTEQPADTMTGITPMLAAEDAAQDGAEPPENMARLFSAPAVAISAEEILSLTGEDLEQLRADVLECIAASGGYEEPSDEETVIFAVIPLDRSDAFRTSLETLGALQQLQYAQSPEGASHHVFEITLCGQ